MFEIRFVFCSWEISVVGKINISYEIMPGRLGVCVYGKCLHVGKGRKGEKVSEGERERTF